MNQPAKPPVTTTDADLVTEIVQLLRHRDVDYPRAARICRRAARVFEGDSQPAATSDGPVDFMTLLDDL